MLTYVGDDGEQRCIECRGATWSTPEDFQRWSLIERNAMPKPDRPPVTKAGLPLAFLDDDGDAWCVVGQPFRYMSPNHRRWAVEVVRVHEVAPHDDDA